MVAKINRINLGSFRFWLNLGFGRSLAPINLLKFCPQKDAQTVGDPSQALSPDVTGVYSGPKTMSSLRAGVRKVQPAGQIGSFCILCNQF